MKQKIFEATLISMPDNELELNNEKKTKFKLPQIEFVNRHGELKRVTAQCFHKSYTDHKMEEGKKYRCVAELVDGVTYLRLSHLPFANYATEDDFDFNEVTETTTVTRTATQPVL